MYVPICYIFHLRDELDRIGGNEDFAKFFQKHDLLPLYSWRLALVTILQFRKNLSNQQAADSVKGRIDVKYLLGLELTDPGFDISVLSEYRSHLLQGSAERLLLEKLVGRCRPVGLLKTCGKQHVDTDYVLVKIQKLNSQEIVGESCKQWYIKELATSMP